MTPFHLLIIMSGTLFFLGVGSFITGVCILALRAGSNQLNSLPTQTSRLTQKGLAEDINTLVASASDFLDAANELVRTQAGVGVFLSMLGLLLMAAAAWLALQALSLQS